MNRDATDQTEVSHFEFEVAAIMSSLTPVTLTYSTVDGLDIKLDLYVPESPSGATVVFFHGGGLVYGGRADFYVTAGTKWMIDASLAEGYIFISADYRLLFPASSHDQIADVKALFQYLASPSFSANLPANLGSLDMNRIAVAGASAGAYIARLAVIYVQPRPRALLSLFGMGGDLLSDNWVGRGIAPGRSELVTREQVAHFLGQEHPTTVSEAPVFWDPDARKIRDAYGRDTLITWFRQEGLFHDYFTGIKGLGEKLRLLSPAERRAAIPLSARVLYPEILIDESFAPTVLVHGAIDPVVLKEESEETYRQLKELGIETEIHIVDGADHGLIDLQTGGLANGAMDAQLKAFEFVAKHLQ